MLAAALFLLTGCVTGSTIEYARTYSHTTESAEVVIDQKGKPGLYALVPLTIPADVALLPVYIGWVCAVWAGLMEP